MTTMDTNNSVMMTGLVRRPLVQADKVATFILSVKDGNDTTKNYMFDCVAYGTLAKRIASKVRDGAKVTIEGSLRSFSYEDRLGHKHIHTDILVNDITMI